MRPKVESIALYCFWLPRPCSLGVVRTRRAPWTVPCFQTPHGGGGSLASGSGEPERARDVAICAGALGRETAGFLLGDGSDKADRETERG